MMDELYNVECTAIADGIHGDGTGRFARVSVVLRPDPRDVDFPAGVLKIDLLNWTEAIAQLDFEVWIGKTESKGDWIKIPDLVPELDPPGLSKAAIDHANLAAAAWWREIWKDDAVRAAYRTLMTNTPKTAAKVEAYSYALLSDLAYARMASDIQISSLAKALSAQSSALRGEARRRVENPYDPTIRIMDAFSLLERDAFAGLEIGDPFSMAISTADRKERSSSVDEALDHTFSEIRAAIDQEMEATEQEGKPMLPRRVPWNPFLQKVRVNAAAAKEDILLDRYSDPIFGNAVGKGVRDAPPSLLSSPTSLGLEAFRRLSRRQVDSSPALKADDQANGVIRASRHVANLQAHPTLRKFVRLIVDIPMPLNKFPREFLDAKRGVICVRAKSKADVADKDRYYSDRLIATTFEIDQETNYFEPCPQWQFKALPFNKSLVPSLPLEKGLVQLNIGKGGQSDQTHRFKLEVLDAITAQESFERSVVTMVAGTRKGFTAQESVSDEPGARTRGIMLLDTEAVVPAYIEEKRNEADSRLTPDPEIPTLKYAEDLVDGYRVDVIASRPIAGRSYFSAVGRRLSYNVVQAAFGLGDGTNPYAAYASRDDGFIRSPSAVVPITKSVMPEVRIVPSEVLFTWTGANLALPTPVPKHEEGNQQPLLPTELPVIVTYQFPEEPGPILRSDLGYRIGLRARKLNGGSVSSRFAESFPEHALGDGKAPFFFSHVERTPAPVVLVPGDQILAEPGKDEDQPSATTMIAVADAPNGPSVRMLVSPNIGFNIAEQQGQFDYRPTKPGGAIDSAAKKLARLHAERGCYLRLRQVPDKGGFPTFPAAPGSAIGQAQLFEIVDAPPTKPEKPHYVDRTLWAIGNLLKPTSYTTAFDLSATDASDVAFWKKGSVSYHDGFTQEGVVPIRLEAVAVKGSSKSRIIRTADLQIGPAGRRITVPVMRVEVGPADTLELEVWTKRLEHEGRIHPAVRRAEAFLGEPIDRTTRIASLHEVTRFRIFHPVQLPLAKPEIVGLGATRCSATELEPPGEDLREHQPGAESCFAWGKIRIDRKSTASVWGDCRWVEFDPALYRRRTSKTEDHRLIEQTDALFEHSGQFQSGRLFDLSNLPALQPVTGEDEHAFRDRSDTIDLRRDDQGNLRPLAADFRSTRARKLVTRLVARSRFAPPSGTPGDYSNSLASTPDDVFERYAADSSGPAPDGTAEFWLPATRPPAIPGLTRNYGVVYRRRFDDLSDLPSGERGKTLTHIYRCWLDHRWYDSGPFEKLAIICRGTATTVPDWLLPLLSKWGGDMTMRSGKPLGRAGELASFLEPDQFILDGNQDVGFGKEFVPSILRNMPLSSPTGNELHNVDIALLTPQFHAGSGLWYCDIQLKGAPAFRVDLDLSLARYQHHAITGCNLSKPVAAGGFMLHQPWTFKASRKGDGVSIVVVGPAYIERAPMTRGLKSAVPGDVAQRAGSPFLSVELERVVDGSPLPVQGPDGRAVVTTSKLAKVDWSGPGIPEGCMRWTMSLRVPVDPIYRDALAVRVSLASEHANAGAAERDARDGGLITLPEPMVVQLPIGN